MQPNNDVDDGSEKVAKKDIIYVLSNFLASIWTRSVCKMEATFSGVEFLRTLSRFNKRKEKSQTYVHVPPMRFHVVVVQWSSRDVLKSVMHVHGCCFAQKSNCYAVPSIFRSFFISFISSSDNDKHMRQKTQQEYNSKDNICYFENICRTEHPFTPQNLPSNRQSKTSLLSKSFLLVSEQRKPEERDFRFWPRFLLRNRTETLASRATGI